MIWHPLVWAFWAAAVSGSLLYVAAAWRALDVAANWAPWEATPDQLRREHRAETAALLARGSTACLGAAALTGLVGIALVWPGIVPGAMCGTGVLQAMGNAGRRAMPLWGGSLILLYGWWVTDRLDDHHPQGVLIPTTARLLLTPAPFLGLALIHSWQALMRIDGAPPVSCCAAVYDQVLNTVAETDIIGALKPAAFWTSLIGVVTVPLTLVAMRIAPDRFCGRLTGVLMTTLAMGWSGLAALAVKYVWSAYYYQVLSHPCPWCLFLPDYYGAGFFIFACLAVVSLEGVAFWAADHAARRHPVLAEPAGRRRRQAARRIMAAVIAFALFTMGPALAWRLRSGVWMDGTF